MTARPSPEQIAEAAATVRGAHGKAMDALAADVHPLSGSAIEEWERQMDAALDVLVAAAQQTDEWLTGFDGDGVAWHESLPSPYTYQASDFTKLVTAVHQFEAMHMAAAQQTDALVAISHIDWCIGYAIQSGQELLLANLRLARAALAADEVEA